MAPENEVSNAEIMAELKALRQLVDGLLHDFGPVLAAFRPRGNGDRPGYIELAGAARAARKAQRGSDGRR